MAAAAEGRPSAASADPRSDQQLWTYKLRMHEVVEKSVDPTTALKVGLKVDAAVLPAGILEKVVGPMGTALECSRMNERGHG